MYASGTLIIDKADRIEAQEPNLLAASFYPERGGSWSLLFGDGPEAAVTKIDELVDVLQTIRARALKAAVLPGSPYRIAGARVLTGPDADR